MKTIKWLRDLSGTTVECLIGGQPLPALPSEGGGDLSSLLMRWSYTAGEVTRVDVLESPPAGPYRLLDLNTGRTLDEVPGDAFEFVES